MNIASGEDKDARFGRNRYALDFFLALVPGPESF